MLAERARMPIATIAIVAAATVVTSLAVAMKPEAPRRAPHAIVVDSLPSGDAIEISDYCPPHVRAAIHLGNDATLYCVRGQFPDPGTFVFAQYQTSERWERFAVVGDDGQLLVPMLDRPSMRR